MERLFCEFLQIAIGNRKSLSITINESDWLRLFEFCKRQALIGVGFSAVEKLHAEGVVCPTDLRMKWMALAFQIEKKNSLLNEQCKKLTEQYGHDGLSTCILKGQGNLLNYPEELRLRRNPGDIDIWCIAPQEGLPIAVQTGKKRAEFEYYYGRRAVIEYVRMLHHLSGSCNRPINSYHHVNAPKLDGTEVEVHFRAAHLYSQLRNWRLQKWLDEHTDECMKNKTHLGFAMPTSSVNVVYQLTHMFKHHIEGGLGFRHLMDYYFALRVWYNDVMEYKDLRSQGMWSEGLGMPVMSAKEVICVLRSLGLAKFTSAVMYVLHEVFAMPNHYYICEANEKEGKKLLEEVMNSGNFGQYDSEKPNVYEHRLKYHIWKFKRTFRLAMSYPEEALSEPMFRAWRKVMRLCQR